MRLFVLVLALLFLTWAHIFGRMYLSTPTDFNKQHVWGGTTFHQPLAPVIGNQDPASVLSPSSQARIVASSSDDLFHPESPSFPHQLPPVSNNHAYTLPYPHLSRNHHISHIPLNRDHLSQPQARPFSYSQPPAHLPAYPSSSYNNPSFIPQPEHPSHHYQPSSFHPQSEPYSLGPLPPQPLWPPSHPTMPVPHTYIPLPNQNSHNVPSHPSVPVQYIYCILSSSIPPSSSTVSTKALPSVTLYLN